MMIDRIHRSPGSRRRGRPEVGLGRAVAGVTLVIFPL
jgi:hypothetical protein